MVITNNSGSQKQNIEIQRQNGDYKSQWLTEAEYRDTETNGDYEQQWLTEAEYRDTETKW